MPTPEDEAAAALSLVSRLVINMARDRRKEEVLELLTDCMGSLLKMGRPGAAELLHLLHAGVQELAADDPSAPSPS